MKASKKQDIYTKLMDFNNKQLEIFKNNLIKDNLQNKTISISNPSYKSIKALITKNEKLIIWCDYLIFINSY